MANDKIEVELDSPNGPRVRYLRGLDAEEIEAAIPEGWEVDWETTPADSFGGYRASPLRKITGGRAS